MTSIVVLSASALTSLLGLNTTVEINTLCLNPKLGFRNYAINDINKTKIIIEEKNNQIKFTYHLHEGWFPVQLL